MRKELISRAKQNPQPLDLSLDSIDESALDLDRLAVVQVTSEEEGFSIDAALLPGSQKGWRAASPGTQTIRIVFDEPQALSRIRMVFDEPENSRTQEFVLRWSPDGGRTFREIVRQQWNFSSPNSEREVEDYSVKLAGVTLLELIITPDKSGGESKASIEKLRLT
jgi:hypothetical protein